MRIFLDANVLFSAAKTEGAVHDLLRRLLRARHVLCADTYVVEEARRNLDRKGGDVTHRLGLVLQSVHVTVATPGLGLELGAPLPEKDRPVLCAAVAARCQVLVTGDRTHFGAFYGKTIAGVRILSPRALAEALDL